jgi:hypothetical protein
LFGTKDRVNYDLKHVVHHLRKHRLHVLAGCAQIRVRVALNQPDSEVLVQQKVEPKELKDVFALVRVHLVAYAQEGVDRDVAHARQQVVFNPDTLLGVVLIDVTL